MTKDFRAEAEKHWQFIEGLAKAGTEGDLLWKNEEVKYLYIEAMVHGYKHAQEEDKDKGYNGPG